MQGTQNDDEEGGDGENEDMLKGWQYRIAACSKEMQKILDEFAKREKKEADELKEQAIK